MGTCERSQIDDLNGEAVFPLELFRGLERLPHRRGVGDDRQVATFARDARLADRHDVIAARHLGLDATVQILVLEE